MAQPGRDAEATGRAPGDAMAAQVLGAVRALAVELQPRLERTLVVREDTDLDRELGLDSLARAELLVRLGRNFGVTLPENLLGEARTPGDLLAALRAAGPGRPAPAVAGEQAPRAAVLPPVPEPVHAGTLLDVLAEHAAARGDRVHLWLWRGPGQEDSISYGALDRSARAVAAGLVQRGLRSGERVGLMLPTEPGFFPAFFGVLYAGAIPVPIYPPFRPTQIEDHLRRQSGILRNAEASLLITNEQVGAVGLLLQGLVASLRLVVTAEDLAAAEPLEAPLPATPDTIALIQYTSGSTGDPKGVVLSHANLLANIRAMGQALEASSEDVVASWLPLYHDMGLIGCWLGSLYYGAPAAIMPPLGFLADPARWLWAIHRHRATISAAPNFAYELCLKLVRDEDIAGLDLGSLRRLANGAEPVSPDTIRRFAARFAPCGLRANAMAPVYGLAESVVALAFPPPGRAPLIDRIDRDSLAAHGLAVPVLPEVPDALELVACGQPIPGHEIRIVDESGRELPERHEGRVQFKGPSATAGYFRAPEKTRALFDGTWLESGDRGYIAAGDVYVTGRIKDMIIRAGRHLYPQELEELVGTVEGVRRGCVAAIASPDPASGTERLVVVAETRLRDPAALDDLRRRIVDASRAILPDMPPEEVVLAPPHAIPKTSSGKLRRAATRALYESGGLGRERPRVSVAACPPVGGGDRSAAATRADPSRRTRLRFMVVGTAGQHRDPGLAAGSRAATAALAAWSGARGHARFPAAHGDRARDRDRRAAAGRRRDPGCQPRQLSGRFGAVRALPRHADVHRETGIGGTTRCRPFPATFGNTLPAAHGRGGWRCRCRGRAPDPAGRSATGLVPRRHPDPHAGPARLSSRRLPHRRGGGRSGRPDRDPRHALRPARRPVVPATRRGRGACRPADSAGRPGFRGGGAPARPHAGDHPGALRRAGPVPRTSGGRLRRPIALEREAAAMVGLLAEVIGDQAHIAATWTPSEPR